MNSILFIIIGVASRLFPHPANFTAVGALALFISARFGIKKSLVAVFITMLIADAVKGFHSVMWATYGSLFLGMIIGRFLKEKKGSWILGGNLLSSILFFIITNFAVWLTPNFMYAKTFSGLMECYALAIPFFRNSLMADLLYSFIFFGSYDFLISKRWVSFVSHQQLSRRKI